jgi:hypothetical protein
LKVIRSLLNNIEPYNEVWYISVDNLNEPYANHIHHIATKSKNLIYDYYLNEIEKEVTDKNDKVYKLALYYKQRGLDYNTPTNLRDKYFNLACKNYALLPKSYLEKEVLLGMDGTTDSRKIKRTVFFLYPTMIDEDNYWNPFWVGDFSKNHFFLDYLFYNNIQDSFYYSKDEWNCLQIFLYRYYENTKAARWASNDSLYYTYYDKTSELINRNSLTKSNIDSNFIYLVQANKYFSINDSTNAILYFRKANKKIMMGWEEIAQAGIDTASIAQFWHSPNYALMAVEKGGKLLMSPAKKAYLDMSYDSTSSFGLHWAAFIEVDSAYSWNPATYIDGIPKENIYYLSNTEATLGEFNKIFSNYKYNK